MAGTSDKTQADVHPGTGTVTMADSGATLWQQTSLEKSARQSLAGGVDCDVVVVGAGFTGCSCALTLARTGADVVVLEAGEPGAGASGRNAAGYAGMWTGTVPAAVVDAFGVEQGTRMNAAIAGGADYLCELVREFDLQVDLDPSGILMAAHKPAARAGLEEMARQWTALGNPMTPIDRGELVRLAGTGRHAGGFCCAVREHSIRWHWREGWPGPRGSVAPPFSRVSGRIACIGLVAAGGWSRRRARCGPGPWCWPPIPIAANSGPAWPVATIGCRWRW
ncbi:FAD-binding oxidoreductase [Kineobactrum salinum]|uniref:FAD-binding oxidoreductase n=1 Tax=Kineobactrum salinum TaxID=2708301 RepID=A0A6C0U9T0_9GAMM|nr:FAD-binding oxidoreductase [Kineobactrum salinum]